MVQSVFDQLLSTLELSVDPLAICEIGSGWRIDGPPNPAVVVHYVLTGNMALDVRGTGLTRCSAGSIVIVPSSLAQTIFAGSPSFTPVDAGEITATRDGLLRVDATGGGAAELQFVCGAISSDAARLIGLTAADALALVEDMNEHPFVQQAFAMMRQEMAAPGVGARALFAALMKTCLLLVVRRMLERGDLGGSDLQLLRYPGLANAIDAVLTQPALPHSVLTLASNAGMSRSRFARIFGEVLDMTPMAFVAKARLHSAAEMLRLTQTPVKSIAAMVGFKSRSHFSRAFRQAYGVDPLGYRRRGATGG